MTPTITEETVATPEQFPMSRTELVKLMREVYQEQKKAAGKKVLTLEEIKQEFMALPNEKDRVYELKIAGFARDWADFIIKRINEDDPEPPILQLLPKKGDVLTPDSDEDKCAFAAFAVAINYERLQKNPREEKALLDGYREFFKNHIFFLHLDVLYRMDEAKTNHKDDFLKTLLADAKTNGENLTGNHGGLHAYAETTALVFENASAKLREELLNDETDWLKTAKNAADDAIIKDREYQQAQAHKKGNYDAKVDAYAKFYCTQGRVYALCGDLDAAILSVNRAIELENNTRTDYSIRIGQYASYEQQFRAQQKLRIQEEAMASQMQAMNVAMEEQMKEMQQAMEAQEKESMAKNMEFLGLFSGIVSFTIGSLTITGAIAEQSIKHAAGLIVVLLGALICVFSAFGMILHGFHAVKRSEKTQRYESKFIYRHLVAFALGALVVVGGIVFCLN